MAATRARHLQEQPVGELHDVRLVAGGDRRAPVRERPLEREPHDALAPVLADRLDRDAAVLADPCAGGVLDEPDQLLRPRPSPSRTRCPCTCPRCSRGPRSGPPASYTLGTPGYSRHGRTFANRSSSWRSARFTLRSPLVTGVSTGPFSATRFVADRVEGARRAASGRCGRTRPSPSRWRSQSTPTPVASTARRAASIDLGTDPVARDQRDAMRPTSILLSRVATAGFGPFGPARLSWQIAPRRRRPRPGRARATATGRATVTEKGLREVVAARHEDLRHRRRAGPPVVRRLRHRRPRRALLASRRSSTSCTTGRSRTGTSSTSSNEFLAEERELSPVPRAS